MTERNLEFYASNYGSYSLKSDTAGRAFVAFDDGEGGVNFELAEFLRDTNIDEAREALLTLIGDLLARSLAAEGDAKLVIERKGGRTMFMRIPFAAH